jgi:hypothetical protein
MSYLWYAHQSGQIAEAKTDAAEAKTTTQQYADRVRELEFALGRTTLACQALWELLRARVGITEEELLAKMTEVDLRDGREDGRMTPVVIACPKCGKPSNTKNTRCLYCGAALQKPHVFQ